jgi:hypothetical protein
MLIALVICASVKWGSTLTFPIVCRSEELLPPRGSLRDPSATPTQARTDFPFADDRPPAMTYRSTLAIVVLAALLSSPSLRAQALPNPPAPPPTDTQLELARIDDVGVLMDKARDWHAAGDLRRYTYALERLIQVRPYNGAFQFKLAQAYGEQDMKTPAYDLLLRMQAQGLAYDPTTAAEAFAPVATTNAYGYIVESLQRNAQPFGEGAVAFSVDSDAELLEAIAWDDKRQQLLLGSGRTGEVFLLDKAGKPSVLAAPTARAPWWGALALAVDSKRDALWLATTALPHFEGFQTDELGASAILRLRLSTGELLEHYPIPVDGLPHVVGAMTVADSGALYAVDGVSNFVYKIAGGQLEVLLNLPKATTLRGIALHPGEKLLYLSDYEMGLQLADLENQKVLAINLAGQNFGGIDHLSWFDGNLIAIQNFNPPNRVMRIALDPTGRSVTAMAPLESAKPALKRPTLGVIGGDRFWFIANSQRDYYGPNGRLLDGVEPERRVIYSLSPSFGLDKQTPNLAKDRKPGG